MKVITEKNSARFQLKFELMRLEAGCTLSAQVRACAPRGRLSALTYDENVCRHFISASIQNSYW
jgi:hypothetical protein